MYRSHIHSIWNEEETSNNRIAKMYHFLASELYKTKVNVHLG